MTMELQARYDSRKSFYGKAQVKTSGGWGQNLELHSYGTHVATIGYNEDGEQVAQVYGTYSATTLRHTKEFLKQNGFRADTKDQILRDYYVEA